MQAIIKVEGVVYNFTLDNALQLVDLIKNTMGTIESLELIQLQRIKEEV